MKYAMTEKSCPELSAGFPSKLIFQWFDSFVWMGYRRPLENSDLWNMKPEDTSSEIAPRFLKHWDESVAKIKSERNNVVASKIENVAYQKVPPSIAFSNSG